MSDLLRIFMLSMLMLLSFKLGKEYAFRFGIKKMLDTINAALTEFKKNIEEQSKTDAPDPNETL